MAHPVSLPEGYVLEGRYVLGAVIRTTAGGIVYTAFDKKLRIMAEVLEYLPADCGLQREKEGTAVIGSAAFQEKLMRLLADGSSRMHSADSNIYDVLTANGTAYLVHVAPKNNAVSSGQDAVSGSTPKENVTAETAITDIAASQTRIVEGLFHHDAAETPAESPVSSVDKPYPETAEDPADAPAVKPSVPAQSTQSAAAAETAEENGPSVKLLLAVLAAGVILLLICCGVFLTSLFDIADIPGGTDSLLGVPYTEIADVTEEDWLVVGRGFNDGYAPGTVVAEEEAKNGFRLLINGYTPSYIMPDLVGMTAEGASALLNRTPFTNAAGLVQGQVTVNRLETTDAPHGMVLEQSPAAGTVAKSSLVTLTVADNPDSFAAGTDAIMADLVGQTYQETLSGHPVLISDRIVSEKPAGEILSQYPAAGSAYRKNAPCYVVVSLGSRESRVPDVRFMTLAEAEKALYACGLSFTVEYALHSHVQTGLIAEQLPAAGESIAYGETVTLTVSGEGSWDSGPLIQTELSEVDLAVGDTCIMELGERTDTVYHSTAPDVVSVSENGLAKALTSGSAVVSASAGGQTVVMSIQVSYDKRLPCTVDGTVGEKISLSALGDASDTGTVWHTDGNMASVSDKGILTGKKAGDTLVWGEKNGKVSLYLVRLTEAEEEKVYVTVAKSLAGDKTKMQNALQNAGLSCTVQEEYSDKTAGTVLRIQYTGYSDDKQYYFAEGTKVVLIVSKGRPSVSSVSIASKPDKLNYSVGEKLDTAGLTLKVVYADKSEEVVSKGFTVSYDFSTAGRKTVSVSYEQRKTSFSVEVINNGPVKAEIITKPIKLQYDLKETLDPEGLKVRVTYGNGSAKTFTTGFTTSYSFDKAGTSRVTVTIEGVSAYFDVTVTEKKVRTIAVDSLPTKTTYQQGESINTGGMTLKVNYTDGTTKTVRSGWSVTCDTSSAGRKTVTVSYEGKTTQFYITVEEAAVTAIRVVTQPDKLLYTVGDTIDLTGLELSVTRGGKSTSISWPDSGITCSGDLSKAGESSITVRYGGQSANIRISVKEPAVEMLTVLILPDQLTYAPGEDLDTSGMVLLAEYENGTSARITDGYRTFYDFSESGKADVIVTYSGAEASFTVTVEEAEPLLSLSDNSLTLTVGESTILTIRYRGDAAAELMYQIDAPQVLEVTNGLTGLSLTALREGICSITLSDGTEEVSCTVTVLASEETEKPDAPAAEATVVITHQSDAAFMPMLVFNGNGHEDAEVPFTVTITYDPTKLIAADMAGIPDNVDVYFNGEDTIVITGSVVVPKDGTVETAYVMFFGSDTDAFEVSYS